MLVSGIVSVHIIKEDNYLIERFEEAYRGTMNKYFHSNAVSMEFVVEDRIIDVRYKFEMPDLSYKLDKDIIVKGKDGTIGSESIAHSADIGWSLYEFWAKWVVKTFFEENLKVKSRHTSLTFNNIKRGRRKEVL